MTKYELREYRFLKKELKKLEDRIRELKSERLSPKNQIITGMPRGSNSTPDKFGEVMIQLERLELKAMATYVKLLRACERIENAIETLEDSKERLLMRSRYIDCMSWKDIAKEMNYSVENIYKLHGQILEKLKSV